MKHGVAMKHGGRARGDFHPLGQGRDVCVDEIDLHRLPSCVCVTPQKAWARMRADLPNSASEGVVAPQKALAPRKAL